MKLYLGGIGEEKLDYVRNEWRSHHPADSACRIADGADADMEQILHADVLNHLHLWIRRNLSDTMMLRGILKEILQHNPDISIICDEIGCGIVPLNAEERQYRELTGRICCELAEQATSVERIMFGISQKLK